MCRYQADIADTYVCCEGRARGSGPSGHISVLRELLKVLRPTSEAKVEGTGQNVSEAQSSADLVK